MLGGKKGILDSSGPLGTSVEVGEMRIRIAREGSRAVIVNEEFVNELDLRSLTRLVGKADKSFQKKVKNSSVRVSRGAVGFFSLESGRRVVIRRYLRGGLVARWNESTFFLPPLSPLSETRPYREFLALAHLKQTGVSVPNPVAAYVLFSAAGMSYRGYLLTERIDQCINLLEFGSQALARSEFLDEFQKGCWSAGREAKRMLDAGYLHTDLHIGNVLWRNSAEAYLLDFDKVKQLTFRFDRNRASRHVLTRWGRSAHKHGFGRTAIGPFQEGFFLQESSSDE